MTKPTLTLGAEPKKIGILGLLVVALGGVWWINRTPDPPRAASAARVSTPAPAAGSATPSPIARLPRRADTLRPAATARPGQRGASAPQEFKPSLKPKDQTIDPTKIDPTLKLGLLAKLQTVEAEGGARSLFEFSAAPAPKIEVKPIKPGPVETATTTPPTPSAPKPEPPKPPIPLKFYGYVSASRAGGAKSAFFLDGEEIFVAKEGDLIRNRYKIVRIGVNSAVVEDTTNKNQQTLPMAEEASG